jgi:amino acid adenylation domain-containing protein
MIRADDIDVTARLLALAARSPTSPAILAPGCEPLSFGALAEHLHRTRAQLEAWGIRRGDIVVWANGDRTATAVALAVLPASSTIAPVNPAATFDALHDQLARMRPKAVVVPGADDSPISRAARRLGLAEMAAEPCANRGPGAFDLVLARPTASLDAGPRVSADWACLGVTSGSTGRPKLVSHGHRQVVATALATGERLAIGPADISGHLMPLHLAGGIRNALFQSLLNGGAVNVLPHADVDAFIEATAAGDVTFTSASFTILRELLARLAAGAAPFARGRLRFVRVASGRLEPDEMDRLEEVLGVPVLTGLASSETGTTAQQALPPAPRKRGSVGLPVESDIRLVDERGHEVARGGVGEIHVRGPQLFDGYFDDADLQAASFVDGWFRMGDLARFDDDGELHLVGRVKEIINRGGDKIAPLEIDAVLRSVPGVADAAAFGVPHPRLGEEVVAVVVPKPGHDVDAESLLRHARSVLGANRAPRRVYFTDALPRTDGGKVRRHDLPAWLRLAGITAPASPASTASAPMSPVEVALAALWTSVLKLSAVPRDADFFMLGGDSLRGVELLDQVHAVFGVEIAREVLFDDAATLAGMARRIEAERVRTPDRPIAPTIRRRPDASPVPLSSPQLRAWFLHCLDPASSAYNEIRLWRIDGPLDVDALRNALLAVAVRQPMLRTRFVGRDGEPWQMIDAQPATALEIVPLTGTIDDEPQRLDSAVRERAERPFDLAAHPLLRWTLFELGEARYALLRVWHHIIGDGLSASVLQRDLSSAYAAALRGDTALPPLAVDYADYVAWQRSAESQSRHADAVDYWKRTLANLPVLAMPADFRRRPAQSFRGAVVSTRLERTTVAGLKAIGRSRKASSFVTFLAVFSVLMSRLSGDDDVAIGTPVAGRPVPELAGIIGYFANTLVFRADLRGAPSTLQLIERTREQVRAMLAHDELPFEQLVDVLKPARDPSRNPLFQVAFALREADAVELHFPGLQVRRVRAGVEHAKFDLTLSMIEDGQGIDARWEFCTDLFERSTVERMARQYATLVEAMAATPEASVATLPLMDAGTYARILELTTAASCPFPASTTIHARFYEHVRAHPGAPAIGSLDYQALESLSNQLAHELVSSGVAANGVVAVARQRTADIAVAWLAVLKAGAAYLPIDPSTPPERIGFMLADAGATHAIVDDVHCGLFATAAVTVVQPDRDASRIAASPTHELQASTGPEDTAYVTYTSGSTGRPKGVAIPHRAVLRLVCGTDCAQLGRGDAVAQLANPAFDASTFEFWGPLLNGARIVPIAKTTAISPRALAAAIAAERVTGLFLTTALFNVVASDVPAAFASCRFVLFGGEAVDPDRVAAVIRAGPPRHLIHVYGPTETTTFATWHDVRDVASNALTIPIGKPLANTEVHVLRRDFELAAPGEPGEICIAGPGLARGYVNADDAHAARFVVRAIGTLPPRRLYRSGDIGRLRDDGAIEFVGRRDQQVKIRGHRIELEEIETVLARLPQVRAAAVAVRGEGTDNRQLVAYLVSADASRAPAHNLFSELRTRLPDYMLPSSIVWLQALPLNASGKLDRQALQAVAAPGVPRAGSPAPPRDMFERVLVRIWEDVLNVRGLGVFDHFFDNGGDSLMAVRLVNAIERETGLEAPLTALFIDDTVAGLARVLREGAVDHNAPIVPINAGGMRPPFVFLHGDFTGGGFYSRSLAHAMGPEQPTLIVHPHGLVAGEIPGTIETMAADRIRALREIRRHGPYVLGGHCNGAFVAFEMARQLMDEGERVPAVVMIEARAPRAREALAVGVREAFVTIDPRGGIRTLVPRDRLSDANLRYAQAMDRYVGGHCATHVVIVRSRKLEDRRRDLGWSRLAATSEIHEVPGDHVTLITGHAEHLARVVKGAIAGALQRVVQ